MKKHRFPLGRILWISCLLALSLFATACAATFRGKIIDADTKQPIEGAVVVATWSEETTTIGATHTRLKDVKEVLTNKNGEWEIHGPRGKDSEFMENIMAFLGVFTGIYYTRPPEIIYFKPGYCSYPSGYGIPGCKNKIKFEKDIRRCRQEEIEKGQPCGRPLS